MVAVLEYVWLFLEFLRPRRSRAASRSSDQIYVAGPIDRFESNSVTPFPKGKFYLVRLQDGSFLALHRECTHLGCTVPWSEDERKFVCPCHASSYDIRGVVLTSPAPRPLDWLPVRVENGIVKVVPAERQRRSEFRPSQVHSL